MANLKSNVKVTKVKNLWVIDPNGEDSTAANLEDLNISVELEVLVRGDEPIIYSKNNVNSTNPTSNEKTKISFIDGAGNEEKYLTTHYTELNTKFNRDNKDLGTLGIETIDISFNTSYVPIVKIKFKDIRGQLFELGEESPYAFLFKMPYPIFYLTVKGYYGKPVQYALHMTKFNGNLDNETGSFIITCDFIGYTYAFLSDLLMGILKGTPYTQKGLNAIKSIEGFTTFDKLRSVVQELENYIIKFRQDNKQLKALTIYDKLNTKLLSIEQSLTNVFPLIFENYTKLTDTGVNTAQNMAVAVNTNANYFTNSVGYLTPYTLSDTVKKEYKNSTLKLVEEYNELNQVKGGAKTFSLNIEDFQLDSGGIFYNGLKIDDFIRKNEFNIPTTPYSFDEFQNIKEIKKYLNFKIKEQNDIFIREMYGYTLDIINTKYRDNDGKYDTSVKNVVDIRFALNKVRLTREKLQEEFDKNKKLVTETFTEDINSFLNSQGTKFDASIGSLFKILCDHVDLFIDVVKNLEEEIENDRKNGNRNLQAADKRNFTEFITVNGSNQIAVAPFPEYVEDEGKDTNGDGTLVEKWLGSKRKFSEYAEVKFINDLYDSIKMAAKKDKEVIEGIYADSKAWFPINPLETLAFDENNENPWNSVIHSNIQPVMKLIAQRMALFLGYSHKDLTIDEINEVAKIEANQAYNALIDVKKLIIEPNGSIDTQINTYFGDNEETFGKVGQFHGLRLYFDKSFLGGDKNKIVYHHDKPDDKGGGFKNFNDAFNLRQEFIPINQTTKSLDDKVNELNTSTGRASFDGTFISNVISNSQLNEGTNNDAENEKFIKIIDKSTYNKQLSYESYVTGGDGNGVVTEMAEKELVNTHNSLLGGRYRTHEFMTYKTSPLFYEFYDSTLKKNLIARNDGKNYIFNPTFKSNKKDYNLFGSRFYYNQSNPIKALLFLHTIPFAGISIKKDVKQLLDDKSLKFFNQRAGFVSIPYSYVLFLGGLFYRDRENIEINFTANSDILIPNLDEAPLVARNALLIDLAKSFSTVNTNTDTVRTTTEKSSNFHFTNRNLYSNGLGQVLSKLPESVKTIFINEFTNWLNGDWLNIQDNLEIFDDATSDEQIITTWDNLKNNSNNTSSFKANSSSNYKITPNTEKGYFNLEIISSSPASDDTFSFLSDEKVLINGTYRIWEGKTDRISNFEIKLTEQKAYLTTFFSTYKSLNVTSTNPDAEINKSLFGTDKVDDIKLGLYKNVKSIYNKWILGVHPSMESIITGNLYKNFNFLDRAYIDISAKFKVSPTGFVDYLSSNSNISFYNFIARVLRDNNFDFIPLPTFIDYSSEASVTSIFEPYNFNDSVTATEPQFVCMYFGEQSNQLNIDKKNTKRPNDSFSLPSKYDSKGNLIITDTELPTDFKDGGQSIPYFLVNYADQNQSIFKEIHLDQSEFTETNESLQIIDSLSKLNRNNSIGQNLFDVYNNRSYSAEVEMLGCAQIQPFMFFQINNVPIFDGAYTIINTRHHIKANHMTTTFKGVRIRRIKTKMVDDETLYAHLLANLDEVDSKGASLNDLTNGGNNTKYIFTKPTTAELNQNQVNVKKYFKDRGYNKEIVAGIMGNIQIESSFNLSAVNSRDTNALVSIGLIQWNFGSYPDVFQLFKDKQFATVEQQLDYLTKMDSWNTFIKEVNIITPPVTYYDEQYVAFLFAHYVEVCCGCARTRGYNTLNEIYRGPYTDGWRCPQDDPNATKFFPHKRSQAASYFMKRFDNPKDELYWKDSTTNTNYGFISSI